MAPWGISPVSICICNSCQSEIRFKTVLGGGRRAHKEAVCLKPWAYVKKKRLSSEGSEMATFRGSFFSPLPSSQKVWFASTAVKIFMCVTWALLMCIRAGARVSHFRQQGHPSQFLLHSSSAFISAFSLRQKKVLHDPLMQDYWIKEHGSCNNLPH